MMRKKLVIPLIWLFIVGLVAFSPPAEPALATTIGPVTSSDAGAVTLARAMMTDTSRLLSARFVSAPASGTPHGTSDAMSFFPTSGATFAILTTGNASYANAPNNSGGSGVNLGGVLLRGNSAYDVSILEISFRPPTGANCLRLDFAFYTEEYPVESSSYNDAFIAELDQTTWTTSYQSISAPNKFAIASVNSTSLSDLNSAGTTYDGATVLMQGAVAFAPNIDHKLYLSIFDQNDRYYDSAAFIDNLRFETSTSCTPAKLTSRTPVILLPGVAGTQLVNHQGEIWPRPWELGFSLSDEFLLPLRLDATGTGPLYPDNPDYSTVHAGQILTDVLGQDFYGHAIATFEQAGYQQGVDLFLFPYDWRQNVETLADQLLVRIDQIRAQTGAQRVDIVAHSMGGMITRAVLADPASVGKVRKVVTLGTPVLGAPKMLGVLEYQNPCFVEPLGICVTNREVVQQIVTNVIPAYQMLPSPAYDTAHMPPINIDRDTNGDKVNEGPQNYTKWTVFVGAHRNNTLMQMNALFHQVYDNLVLADPSVQFYRVVGDQMNTMLQMREYLKCTFFGLICSVEYELVMGDGDGTVPLHSADLYNPAKGFDYRRGIANAYSHGVSHESLPGNDNVLRFVLSFFGTAPSTLSASVQGAIEEDGVRGEQDPTAVEPGITTTDADSVMGLGTNPEPFGGIELEVLGKAQGAVQDQAGNLLGLSPDMGPDAIVQSVPGGIYHALGNTQSFFLNQAGAYSASFNVVGEYPISLRVRTYAEGAMNGQAVFNLNAPVGASFQIAFASGQELQSLELHIDSNADGVVDQIAIPDSSYVGPAAAEIVPPTTSAALRWVSNDVSEVSLVAQDQRDGTGVAYTYYRILNGEAVSDPMLYKGPFSVQTGAEVQFFSADNVGNTEMIQSIQTVRLDVKPGTSNTINLKSKKTVSAAILSTPTFDAATVNTASILLAGAPVAVGKDGLPMVAFDDVNRDGLLDLVFNVDVSSLKLDGASTQADLIAQTSSGIALVGVDAVMTNP